MNMMSTSCVSNFYMLEALYDIRPDVPKEFKPTKSMRFKDVYEGVRFYKRYAEKAGFDVCKNTLRKKGDIIEHRYMVCNRMGTNDYKFDKFQENHNHNLEDTFHLKSTRTLSYYDKEFIVHTSTMKMGATKAYKPKSILKGGFQHGNKVWNAMFWADESEKAYTTVNSEMSCLLMQPFVQKMVFVPFTVIDHHKSSVTIGVGLLSTEDIVHMAYHEETTKKALVSRKIFNKLVWDMYIKRDVFEWNWELLMKKLNLEYERITTMSFKNNDIHNVNLIIKLRGAHYSLKYPRMIEEDATNFYTSKLFFEVQKQIYKGGWYCDFKDLGEGDGWELFKVIHMNHKHEVKATRWRKDVKSSNYQLSRDHFDEEDAYVTKLVNEVFFNIEPALDIMRDDKQKLASLAEKTKLLLNDVNSNSSNEVPITNSNFLERLYNVTIPEDVEILVPDVQHNKGCRKKWLIGEVEKTKYESSKED
uniref:Protein FAR1-RELATED SEQUENCE n=1 Tax=Lactuca sativa TaxID=4236 RepID=A0A9R1UEC9_LACSA|nr:hypothetical protein LSAT_V11C900470900 [Lactuca sativa]